MNAVRHVRPWITSFISGTPTSTLIMIMIFINISKTHSINSFYKLQYLNCKKNAHRFIMMNNHAG